MPTSRKPSSGAAASWLADGEALFDIGLGEERAGTAPEVSQQVGPYRLIEKIGEGGLGVVWRAEQSEPIQREVAVKLIKPGLHYRAEVITRFELERQALARMQHPNIAAILDADTLPDGRPYFVMELVQGLPLTKFCAQHPLGVRARLELFITICLAVHHAHQKGILHRDLKPSNILVTMQDGHAVPKIIDFGIAKALDDTDPALSDPFFQTKLGDLPAATYQYMSPEQASRGAQDVDTRSDIYTLGVILYEMLTGVLPLPDELARSGQFDEIARHVREVDPPRPSVRVTSLQDETRTSQALRGDLDWIVLRAMEKDRERRYESAAALAADLQRHLAHEPVTAGPPSAWYRCGKFVRRHRVAFGATTAVLLSLCTGFASTWMALQRERSALSREAEQRSLAQQRATEANAARDAEALARKTAERARDDEAQARSAAEKAKNEAVASREVADQARARAEQLINDMLFDLRDKLEPIGRVSLLEQVAQSAAEYFDAIPTTSDNDAQQRNRGAMLQNRGNILLAKGDATAAMEAFQQSLLIMRERAKLSPSNVQRLHDLAIAHERVGNAHEVLGAMDAARASYVEMRRVFDHLEKGAEVGEQPWRVDQAIAHERLGDLLRRTGDLDAAQKEFESGLAMLADRSTTIAQQRSAVLLEKLGSVCAARDELDAARQHFEHELSLLKKLSDAAPEDARLDAAEAIAHGHLAGVLLQAKGDALPHAKAQAEAFEKLVQQDPLNVVWQHEHGTAEHELGVVLEAAGQVAQAKEEYRDAIEVMDRLHAARPKDEAITRDTAASHLRLAAVLYREEKTTDAKSEAERTLKLLAAVKPDAEVTRWRETALALLK